MEKVVKDAVESKKYKSGFRETLASVKGSKLLIISNSVATAERTSLQDQAKAAGVPVYEFQGNSVQLGKMCNRPYRVSAIAIKSGTTEEIDAIMSGKDSGK